MGGQTGKHFEYEKLIKTDIEKILNEANFNDRQRTLFNFLIGSGYKVDYTDVHIMQEMGLCETTYYHTKRNVKNKVMRILNMN